MYFVVRITGKCLTKKIILWFVSYALSKLHIIFYTQDDKKELPKSCESIEFTIPGFCKRDNLKRCCMHQSI